MLYRPVCGGNFWLLSLKTQPSILNAAVGNPEQLLIEIGKNATLSLGILASMIDNGFGIP
jgi:hypothetical protein